MLSRDSTALSDFEFTTHEHDTDALVLSGVGSGNGRYLTDETFVLRERGQQEQPKKDNRTKKKKKISVESGNRISVLDTEVEQSHTAPVIASPAAFGHGPTLAMPTLLGMGQQMETRVESVDYSDIDLPLSTSSGLGRDSDRRSSSRPSSDRQSRPLSDSRRSAEVPIPKIGQATVDGDLAQSNERKG